MKVNTRTVLIYDPLSDESTLTFMEFKDKLFNDKFNLVDITKMQNSNEFIVTFEKDYEYNRNVVIETPEKEPEEEIPPTDIETPEQLPIEIPLVVNLTDNGSLKEIGAIKTSVESERERK
ncbi:hypothetical protein [Bacillus toyonensis]|uniref:hypothetical protein n=1 Tax=Bacillus toyonensis TaxID=155322 RepID=UPI00027BEABB|nr:hypothetical protein [Bacillus toyonensis]EJV41795.1 hypothetical protein IEA_05680 [Bacillus toyonensis]